MMGKRKRKNPHAVALGRLGGLVRSDAKKRAKQTVVRNARNAARAYGSDRVQRVPPLVAHQHNQGHDHQDESGHPGRDGGKTTEQQRTGQGHEKRPPYARA